MSLIAMGLGLTTDEAIEYPKIAKPTFLKNIHIGRIRAIKARKGYRITETELSIIQILEWKDRVWGL